MASYAVTVYVLAQSAGVNLRTVQLRFWPTLVAIVVIWLLATFPNIVLLSPCFIQITFPNHYVCVLCILHSAGPASFIHSSFFVIVYGFFSFVLSIVFPIITARYIKKNCIGENKEMLKGMTKFSAFLLLGNSFNMIGIALPMYWVISHHLVREYHSNTCISYSCLFTVNYTHYCPNLLQANSGEIPNGYLLYLFEGYCQIAGRRYLVEGYLT